MKTSKLKLGNHRGNARVWLESKALVAFGYLPGKPIKVTYRPKSVSIRLVDSEELATNHVAGRGQEVAIIDVNSKELRESLGDCSHVQVSYLELSREIIIRPAK